VRAQSWPACAHEADFFFVCEKSIDPGCIVAGIKKSGTFVPATWVGKPGYKLVPNRDYCTFLQ